MVFKQQASWKRTAWTAPGMEQVGYNNLYSTHECSDLLMPIACNSESVPTQTIHCNIFKQRGQGACSSIGHSLYTTAVSR